MIRFWGGPMDGEPSRYSVECQPIPAVVRLPVRVYIDPASGMPDYPTLGAYERYVFVQGRCRYEWRGTHNPKVSA